MALKNLFFIGYLLHRKFAFNDNCKVGVAIYASNIKNIDEIFNKIGLYPDLYM